MEELMFGEVITREISVPGEEDIYTLDLAAGDQVYLAVTEGSANYRATVSANPDTTTVESFRSGFRDEKEEFQISASEDTTIELSVKEFYDNDTGSYNVFVQRVNNPVGATPINIGEYVAGNLSVDGEEDTYTIVAQPGETIFLNISGFGDPSISPDVEVFEPDGTLLTDGFESLFSSERGGQSFTFPELDGGTYTILVGEGDDTNTGSYGFMVQRIPDPVGAISIQPNELISGSIARFGEIDTYTFEAQAGDFFELNAPEAGFSPFRLEGRLYDPNGTFVESEDNLLLFDLQAPLETSGTYTLILDDSNDGGTDRNGIGDYTFEVNGVTPPPPPPPPEYISRRFTVNGDYTPVSGDFNGDGNGDILWYTPGTGADYIWSFQDDGTFDSRRFTVNGDYTPVSGDFNGDGNGDILWYTPGTGADYIWSFQDDGTFDSRRFTVNGDYTPVSGDFNGDGNGDILWYRPGTGQDYLWTFRDNGTYDSQALTVNGDFEGIVGDFDDNNVDDILWYKPGTGQDYLWTFQNDSSYTNTPLTVNGTFEPITGDFDSNNHTDILWYQPGVASDYLWSFV